MPSLIMGVDVGTSSTKGVLVDPSGQVVARSTRSHTSSRPSPGQVEQEPERDWWDGFVQVVRELAARSPRPVDALGLSGMGPCVALCDAADRPLRPAVLYGVDTRASAEIKELATRYGRAALLADGGVPLTSESVGPKLLWLRRHEPHLWRRAARWHTVTSFLIRRLTGRYVMDHGSAASAAPLYSRGAARWCGSRYAEIAPGLEVPDLAWSDEVAGEVTREAADATGLAAGTPVTVGAIDAVAEACSVGVVRPGDVMVMYGTTLLLLQVIGPDGAEVVPEGSIGIYPGLMRGTFHASGNVTTAGGLLDWIAELARRTPGELAAAAAEVPLGSEGLLVLPYFAGMRTPEFHPEMGGGVRGLSLRHGAPHLFRAAMEGIACAARRNLEALERFGGPAARLVAVGGGTANTVWTQIVSDLLGKGQVIPAQTVGASYGSAMLAARAVRAVDDPTRWVSAARTLAPDVAASSRYRALYDRHRRLERQSADEAGRAVGAPLL
ncbi:FGGY-family carbohydrate kinase [Streptomyces regalis]|nr:FGGY family carbohydrate kinase [Streptomyces regalis]